MKKLLRLKQLVQFLLRMLGLSEVAGGYETYAGYIRTYRNTLPDDMTREEWRRATDDLVGQGFTRISIGKAWGALPRGAREAV